MSASPPPHPSAFRLRDALVLLVPLGVIHASWTLDNNPQASTWVAWGPFIAIHAFIPLLDVLIGQDHSPPRAGEPHRISRWVLWVCLPAWVVALLFAASLSAGLAPAAWWGLMLSCGAAGGIVAINVAHELIHRRDPLERALGGALLASVAYGAFKVEHVRGHHLRVATADDPASARAGESLWRFIPRSMVGTVSHALAIDAERGRPETIAWTLLTLALWCGVFLIWDASALALVAGAGLVAIIELETVNYIEHYGLVRRPMADGRPEPVTAGHAWNANTALVNGFLLNLQRHSDHHMHAGKPFTALSSLEEAPQLPAGYGAMVLLAWVPVAWRAVMDPRLARYLDARRGG